jgi:hypothetical protein
MMISVVTPTHQNWPLLRMAMASLEAQTFTHWQHVVVADGPDPVLRECMAAAGYAGHGQRVFAELGRNWHGFLGGDAAPTPPGFPGSRGGRGSRAVSTALAGTYLAAGTHIAYLDADCEYLPKHLQLLAEAIGDADFAFARMQRCLDGRPWDLIGDGTPGYGRIDGNMVVHRAELLRLANWRWGGDADWDLIGRWVAAGASWEYVPEVTIRWDHSPGDI